MCPLEAQEHSGIHLSTSGEQASLVTVCPHRTPYLFGEEQGGKEREEEGKEGEGSGESHPSRTLEDKCGQEG